MELETKKWIGGFVTGVMFTIMMFIIVNLIEWVVWANMFINANVR